MVTTRRSSVGLKAEIKGNTTSEESFNTTFSLQSFWKRVRKLSECQKKAIGKTGFENLLKIPGHMLSKNLLAELMERWCPDKRAFLIVPTSVSNTSSSSSSYINIRITLTDVALVLGLSVTGVPVILREDEPFSDLEGKYGATLRDRKITVASIEKRLDSFGDVVDDDFVRLFLLFTFGKLLFPCADSKVDSRYISLLQDLDKVGTFAWGEALLENIIFWLCKRKEKSDQVIGGCLIFLQIWSYEHIDIGRPKLLDPKLLGHAKLFPRACRWENNKPQPRQYFKTKFEGLDKDQVVCKLQPSPHESKIDIINAIFKDKVIENRTRLNTMDQWIAEKAHEPDLIVVREVQRTEAESLDQLRDQIELPQSTSQAGSIPVVIISDDDEKDENITNTELSLLEENTELKKEINSLREENKTIKDQLQEEYAELRNLRQENKVLKDQFQEQNSKLDALRKENRSSSSEGLLTQLETIIHEYEYNSLACNLLL